jgi:leader peptidase (prepilin peptidase) / N-methyltransferase
MTAVVFFTILLAGILLAIARIDVLEMRIPDALNFSLLGSGVLFWVFHSFDALPTQIANGVGAGLLMWLVRFGYAHFTGRTGLGLGDVKMMGAGAVWVSTPSIPMVLFIASFSGLLFAILKKQGASHERIPFGPFLALGLFASWIMENAP